MAKNFRSIPKAIQKKISSVAGNRLEVRSLLKIDPSAVSKYQHLGLTLEKLQIGETWSSTALAFSGLTSRRNLEGWEVVRKDLPKYTKTFCHEIENFGDASRNGYSTVCIDREVYYRDFFPPPLYAFDVSVDELLVDGSYGVSFTLSENFDNASPSLSDDILFAINLMQENFGVVDVVAPTSPRSFHTEILSWALFPPEGVEAVITWLKSAGRLGKPDEEQTARERLALFEKFQPTNYIRGLGGNDTYVGAKYADDLVVFENVRYGNALYVLYGDWESQTKVPRSKLLELSGEKLDRIVHRNGWAKVFSELMKHQFQKRKLTLARR